MRGRTETCGTPVIFYAITSFAPLPRKPQCFKRLLMRTSLRRQDTGYTGIDRSWSRFTQHFSFDWRHAWPLQIRALTLGMRGFSSIFVDAIPWENNRHFLKPSLVSTQNVVWATTEEIPYCWRVTTRSGPFWLAEANCPRGTTNQKHYPSHWCVIIIEFPALFPQTSY